MIPSAPLLVTRAISQAGLPTDGLFPDSKWDGDSFIRSLGIFAKMIAMLGKEPISEDSANSLVSSIDSLIYAFMDLGAMWLICRRHSIFMKAWARTPLEKAAVSVYVDKVTPASATKHLMPFIRAQTNARRHHMHLWLDIEIK